MGIDFRGAACIHCARPALATTSKDEIFCVADYRFRIRVDVIECTACKQVYLTAESQGKMERTIASFLADEAAPGGDAFRFMRQALGLSTAEAGMALGVSTAVIEACERDDSSNDPRVFTRFQSLVRDQLGPRRRFGRPADGAASIRIDLRSSLS